MVAFGMLERGGDVMEKVVLDVKEDTLQSIVSENVELGNANHIDELRSYRGLDQAVYKNRTVNHTVGKYAGCGRHVNGNELFWDRLKLSIRGTGVHVSMKLLQNHVKEFEYRYNRRKRLDVIFGDLVARI